MITLSLAMIVKNEQDTLERCLNSVKDALDEIIIVDTGSTDQTIEIAKKFTDKVYNFEWIDDFSAARNFAFSKATKEYTMWLDADDIMDKENLQKLIDLKSTLGKSTDSVVMKYITGMDRDGHITFSYYRERIVKTEKHFLWKDAVHEYLITNSNGIQTEIAVIHKPTPVQDKDKGRNLKIYEKMKQKGVEFSPRNTLYYSRELMDNGLFEQAIEGFEAFLKDQKGWVEDNITACLTLARCYNHIGKRQNAFESLFKSFYYDLPRAEVLYELGQMYQRDEVKKAIFYYEMIFKLEKPNTWGFIQADKWDFSPAIALCVLYDRIGDTQQAIKYHKMCKELKPENKSVLYNDKYFATKKP